MGMYPSALKMLAAIGDLESRGVEARPCDVARVLGITADNAAQQMRTLSNRGLIRYRARDSFPQQLSDREIGSRIEAVRGECRRLGRQMSYAELDGFLDGLENGHR